MRGKFQIGWGALIREHTRKVWHDIPWVHTVFTFVATILRKIIFDLLDRRIWNNYRCLKKATIIIWKCCWQNKNHTHHRYVIPLCACAPGFKREILSALRDLNRESNYSLKTQKTSLYFDNLPFNRIRKLDHPE